MHTIIMLVILAVILVITGRTDDFDRGYDAGQQGRYDAAVAYYTKALREGELSRENRARALNNRAIAYLRMGERGRAILDLDAAVMVEPSDLSIVRNRTAAAAIPDAAPPDALAGSLRPQERVRLFGLL